MPSWVRTNILIRLQKYSEYFCAMVIFLLDYGEILCNIFVWSFGIIKNKRVFNYFESISEFFVIYNLTSEIFKSIVAQIRYSFNKYSLINWRYW